MSVPAVQFTLLKTTKVPVGYYSAKDLEALAVFALGAQKVKGPVELSVDLTGHERIHELNRRFRGVDRTTDVISFRNAPPPALEGDLAINVHQAALQAKKMKHSTKREIRLLLIHGILHLLGYTDYEPGPRRRMFKRQNALLLRWERNR
jgi:probable rRNA maturation factor